VTRVYRRRAKGRRESALEAWCVKWARSRKIVVAKLTECAGVPDRIFFIPGRRVNQRGVMKLSEGCPLIIEFKERGEKPEELQDWYLAKLLADGYDVGWCDTKEDFLGTMLIRGIT
jgi:hypothetical protein